MGMYEDRARVKMANYRAAASGTTDEKAILAPELFDRWSAESVAYAVGDRVRYGDLLYKCLTAHTSQESWEPDATPALWTVIDETHAGTVDDPVPAARGMEYTYGLYYLDGEDGNIYLCERNGAAPGDKITLQYLPHELVGQYFTLYTPETV